MKVLNDWWKSLNVCDKERIASKVEGRPVSYPYCTLVWVKIPQAEKEKIYDHCVNHHGLELDDWSEGKSMSY